MYNKMEQYANGSTEIFIGIKIEKSAYMSKIELYDGDFLLDKMDFSICKKQADGSYNLYLELAFKQENSWGAGTGLSYINKQIEVRSYKNETDTTPATTKYFTIQPIGRYNSEINYEEKEDGTVRVYAASKDITSVTIPSTIKGKTVTSIGDFSECTALQKVTIPNTVTSIEHAAFGECTSLKSITIPDSVKERAYEAFISCKSLENIKLPKYLKTIESYTFYECEALKSITIPSYVEEIGWCSFEASGLETFIAPNSVKTISSWAFGNCKYLKSIYLPKGIETIYDEDDGKAFGSIPASQLTIYGYKNTPAQTVAKGNGYKFVERQISFLDVKTTDWYFNAVKYVSDSDLIKGSNAYTFDPNTKLTRGMLVTILYRMDGNPKVSGTAKFPDVKSTDYYSTAIKWASDRNIVSGYSSGKFGPNDNITREQLSVILRKYAKYKGKNVSSLANISSYIDARKVSSFAKEGVQWAIAKGIISGKDNGTRIDPQGSASRAEAAAMITSYCSKVK